MKVIVYDDKDNVVYAQWIDKRVIKLRKLIDKLEIFFMALTMDMEDELNTASCSTSMKPAGKTSP